MSQMLVRAAFFQRCRPVESAIDGLVDNGEFIPVDRSIHDHFSKVIKLWKASYSTWVDP